MSLRVADFNTLIIGIELQAIGAHRSTVMVETKRRAADVFVMVVLGLAALGFAAFGLQWLAHPAVMAEPLGITLGNGDATSDARAVYGGLELGLGIFFAYSLWSPGRRTQGLVGATMVMLGLGLSRLGGTLVEAHGVSEATYRLLATDLGGCALCAAALWVSQRSSMTTKAR
jgi:hypothetical protein